MYTVYSYEVDDRDIDFLERLKSEGTRDTVEEAFSLAHELDEKWEAKKNEEKLIHSITHLVFDKDDKRVNGYPGLIAKISI
jgi:hypothetical protein